MMTIEGGMNWVMGEEGLCGPERRRVFRKVKEEQGGGEREEHISVYRCAKEGASVRFVCVEG